MTIAEIKNNVIKETESLKKWEQKVNNILTPIMGVILILGAIIVGMIVGVNTDADPTLYCLLILIGIVIGFLILVLVHFVILNPYGISQKADIKADEISMSHLLPMFSKALRLLTNSEQSILIFEKHLKEAAEKKDVTWFDTEGTLKIDWSFAIKNLECEILGVKSYIRSVLINEDLSSTTKTIIEIFCSVCEENKDCIMKLAYKRFFVAVE